MLEFAKLHALGNDFIVASTGERTGAGPSLASMARRVCDRHRGVGADGILFYQPTQGDTEADVSALIFNADGSRAEMSGNGIRCLAAYLYHAGLFTGAVVRIRTVSGIRVLTLREQRTPVYLFEASMGEPVLDAARVPVRIAQGPDRLVDHPLTVAGREIRITTSSLGNPHCSTFWDDLEDAPVDSLGASLENHPWFPNRMNVEFIQVVDRHRIRVRFWERGVGRTLASGTGSSAAAVASILLDLAESPVTVETELGSMSVRWKPGEELRLTGPAEFVCSGTCVEGEEK